MKMLLAFRLENFLHFFLFKKKSGICSRAAVETKCTQTAFKYLFQYKRAFPYLFMMVYPQIFAHFFEVDITFSPII